MTAILASVHGSRVLIGADRALTSSSGSTVECKPKVIRVGDFVVAAAGSLGGYWEGLQKRKPKTVSALTAALGGGENAEVIFARHGTLYLAYWEDSDDRWAVLEINTVATTGNGGAAARGAWEALQDLDPEERTIRALEISAKCCAGVEGPFDLLWTKPKRRKRA